MKPIYALMAVVAVFIAAAAYAGGGAKSPDSHPDMYSGKFFKAEEAVTTGSAGGIAYNAIAGTLVVHPKGWNDSAQNGGDKNPDAKDDKSSAEASMFFVYYAKRGAAPGSRPITFLFNGGPGSASVWLHMGAFGPKRVVTKEDSHTPAAPYKVIPNAYTLLDVSDLVFIDAPGTGFSRIAGKDKEKEFWGVDPDATAFSNFIQEFLSKYGRWNSPKYLFGESYGTPRASILVNDLESNHDVDFNGVMLLSAILNFDLSVDGPTTNPGIDLPYQLALPTYAATAWYHHKLPGKQPPDLVPFVRSVERFAMTDYALALSAGSSLPPARRLAIAQKLNQFTGLPVSYILKADLRIDGGEFEKNLQDNANMTTGRLDTRFSGPTLDPLSKESDYDPQSAAISSAYVSAFNDYVRQGLNYGQGKIFHPSADVFPHWEFKHQQPGAPFAFPGATNVMPDLAYAMKYNPDLKVLVLGGYYDLATPYYEGWYETHHLPIPPELQKNISYKYFPSGHMVYAHEESLKDLHDTVAAFIRQTDNL
ncbi:MAG: peptidase S10 [Proteobacteria bacterium]|nr:peptidase S10 [Pseudomonadota bacterium]